MTVDEAAKLAEDTLPETSRLMIANALRRRRAQPHRIFLSGIGLTTQSVKASPANIALSEAGKQAMAGEPKKGKQTKHATIRGGGLRLNNL